MPRVFFAMTLVFSVAMPLLPAEETPSGADAQTYVDNTYKVMLRFPGEWKRDPRIYQDRPYFSSEVKPHVVIHSFQILVMGDESTTPEQACKGEATHVLKPFGETPTIRLTKVDGQSACFVFPSKDQGAPWYAAAFIKYPEPVQIEGDRWSMLALYADKDYFSGMVGSLHFISSARPDVPFLLTISPANIAKPGATWKTGEPFPLLLTMKNSSDKIIHVGMGNPASDYRVVATLKTERVRVTATLPEANGNSKGANGPPGNVAKTVEPNETCQDAIEIRFWAERERTGEYSVQVERDLPPELGKGIVESNTITVRVIE